ncbi:UNVERIFIED_CONTAM: hypothetical protein GTU68_041998 [Idotea baltica]|nr:hypothetical protein [Idotea baltica]
MAEVIFENLVKENNLENKFYIDSAGTGSWHQGSKPHKGTRSVLKKNNLTGESLQARQVEDVDFEIFDIMVAMDTSNKKDLEVIKKGDKTNIILLRDFDDQADSLDVPDPYFKIIGGFERVYEIIDRSCRNLLVKLEKDIKI